MNLELKMAGPVLEDEGMCVFEHWGREFHPLEELIADMNQLKKKD